MEERRSDESLEPMVKESLPLLNGLDKAAKRNSSLGEDLKRARMLGGHSLEEVSEVLRIRLVYLESLESGEFDELPGLTYAVGFLRSYSAYLDLDPDAMVARLKEGSDGAIAKPDLSFHVPNREISRPRPILIFTVLILAGIAYGGWHLYSTQGEIANELVTDVSTTLTEVAGFSNDDEVMVAIASKSIDAVEVNTEDHIKSSEITRDPLNEETRITNTKNEEVIQNLNNSEDGNEVISESNLKTNDIEVTSDSDTEATGLNSIKDNSDPQINTGATGDVDRDDPKVYGEENINFLDGETK